MHKLYDILQGSDIGILQLGQVGFDVVVEVDLLMTSITRM